MCIIIQVEVFPNEVSALSPTDQKLWETKLDESTSPYCLLVGWWDIFFNCFNGSKMQSQHEESHIWDDPYIFFLIKTLQIHIEAFITVLRFIDISDIFNLNFTNPHWSFHNSHQIHRQFRCISFSKFQVDFRRFHYSVEKIMKTTVNQL